MTQVIFMGKLFNVKPDVAGESSCGKCAFNINKGTEISASHGCIFEYNMTTLDGTPYTNNCLDSKSYYEEVDAQD
jgi:hypothetical protein